MGTAPQPNQPWLSRVIEKMERSYNYVAQGVWSDTRSTFKVNLIKTLSLSVRSFLNTDLQMRAGFLTYQTILAIVPAFALLFAIGRGFGFQNILQSQLFNSFPAQKEALSETFKFVDAYLAQASEGVFVGIGILFLLYTIVSLLSSVEDCFNRIWGVKQGRTVWRKLTDYTAISIILPILMICSGSIMVFMSTALHTLLPYGFLTPLIETLFDFASLVLIWLFFAGTYMLIPNAKVKFKNALIAGIIAGTAYAVLQWLFVSGQLYVTRYNAIYGSFAFLPLLLIWLQLVWVITLSGGVLCFSSQNIFEFSFSSEAGKISGNYKWQLTVAVMTVVVQRFINQRPPLSIHDIAVEYGLPVTLVNEAAHKLVDAGLMQQVICREGSGQPGLSPAIDPSGITVGTVMERLGATGTTNFIPLFNSRFVNLSSALLTLRQKCVEDASKVKLADIEILPAQPANKIKDKSKHINQQTKSQK